MPKQMDLFSNLNDIRSGYDLLIGEQCSSVELEVRIGHQQWGKYQNGVSKRVFERVQSILAREGAVEVLLLSDHNKGPIRRITDQTSNVVIWSMKETVKTVEDAESGYQISLACEKAIEPIDNFRPTFMRMKTRYSYDLGIARVDMTIVQETGKSDEVYEIEIEYSGITNEKPTENEISQFGGVVARVMEYVKDSPLIYTYSEVAQLQQKLSRLFGLTGRLNSVVASHRLLRYKDLTYKGIVGNPETGYSVGHLPKGQRKLLIISKGVWLYFPGDEPEITLLSRENMGSLEGSVLDGISVLPEFRTNSAPDSKYWFTMIDALFVGDQDVRKENAQLRRARGQEVIEGLRVRLGSDPSLAVNSIRTPAINSPRDFFIQNTLLFDELPYLGYKPSGLIFTPVNMSYTPNLERGKTRDLINQPESVIWRHPWDLTIDLRIVHRLTADGKRNVELWVRTDTGKEVEFKGTQINPLNSNMLPDLSNYSTGTILEFALSGLAGKLEVVRSRDKSLPNTIKDARDIWDSMYAPIDREVLTGQSVELFKKYHARMRRMLFELPKDKSSLMVINPGRGQDVASWIAYDKIYLVDPHEDDIKELLSRIDTFNIQDKVFINQQSGLVSTLAIMIDTATLTDARVAELASTHLKAGGTLILAVMDGDKVAEVMNPYLNPLMREYVSFGDRGQIANFTGTTFTFQPDQTPESQGDLASGSESGVKQLNRFRLDSLILDLQNYGFGEYRIMPFDTEKLLPDPDLKLTRFYSGFYMVRNTQEIRLPPIQYPTQPIRYQPKPLELPTKVSLGAESLPTKVSLGAESLPSIYFPTMPRNYYFLDPEKKQSAFLPMLPARTDAQLDNSQKLPYDIYPDMYRVSVIGEGSCYIHAVLLGFDVIYQNTPEIKARVDYVSNLRRDLALEINQPDPFEPGKTYYESVANGSWVQLAEMGITFESSGKEYSYKPEDLQRLLNSRECLGSEVFDYINRIFGINVWIFEGRENEMVPINRPEEDLPIIVIINVGNHYELVTVEREDPSLGPNPARDDGRWLQTWFEPTDEFINKLRDL